jgi:hypothetical protein
VAREYMAVVAVGLAALGGVPGQHRYDAGADHDLADSAGVGHVEVAAVARMPSSLPLDVAGRFFEDLVSRGFLF